ncbi:glycosyltransferase family 9 protein [Pseudobacteriovorax antillogorgiicola]|uniref:ADP-heptose:LPS heptosyltransferase n=1 Tax=Pseudobacteriovorax antillogorgiicola TaxID=1513793 RepID=A0A1Y6CPF0_9BACT|nr:glycosyltransferase family 9 protein [Pseudobacteriovorax antillogorgiicola]TCS46719.1 ADP-heptose:LPS heptosyltransferase [Pseudobacteriovorax antillogorgiicola]SMF67102.1 ADP-heptose:LPS heptosyltransferase [Pseudobacteriovorax antillogorgiicola]
MLNPSPTPPAVKVAIFRSTSIGDVVLATACIDLLGSLSAPVELTWIGRSPSLQLIASAYPGVKTVEVNPEQSNYVEEVVEAVKGVHLVVDLQMSIRSRAICRSIQKTYGIQIFNCHKKSLKRGQMVVAARLRGRRNSLPTDYQKAEKYQYDMMSTALRLALRSHLPVELYDGIKSYQARPKLPTSHDDGQRPWQKELKFGHWIAIAPGASHEAKRAPEDLFVDILNYLRHHLESDGLAEKSLGLLFVGNEDDRGRALTIVDKLRWKAPVLNLAGKLSLWESALAIKECSIILSNDSSLCHIGEALDVPSAVLFGPTVEAFGFPPWQASSRAFSAPLGCRPCSKHGKADCRFGDKLCFSLLPAADIASHVYDVIQPNLQDSQLPK